MSNYSEQTYWITLAHMPRWGSEKINKLIVRIYQAKLSLEDFFDLNENDWSRFELNPDDIINLQNAKKGLPNNSFLAESLMSQGFEIIPITSPEYSGTLKENLKIKYSPVILYIKGNKQILQEDSIAIVGSREAADISLRFTDNIARIASEKFKVVVSGFAKGVDKQALDSALKYNGQSIIVLPQGILTFASGITKYYKGIVEGTVLVLSIYPPNAPWSTGLAMGRNPIIYGLAKEIYVAQSSEKGGTWEGVRKGLKMGRKIYVRKPEAGEQNANNELISLGGIPVDFNGREPEGIEKKADAEIKNDTIIRVEEPGLSDIMDLLNRSDHPLTAKEISQHFKTGLDTKKISQKLKNIPYISKTKTRPPKYSINKSEGTLFGDVES